MAFPFGNGSDGNVIISVNTTLTADKNYKNLTVNSGVTLNTAGFTVRVQFTLTNNGVITDSSSGGAGGGGGGGDASGCVSPGTGFCSVHVENASKTEATTGMIINNFRLAREAVGFFDIIIIRFFTSDGFEKLLEILNILDLKI